MSELWDGDLGGGFGESISIWAGAEESGSKRKAASQGTSKEASKASARATLQTSLQTTSQATSKATDRSVRSTRVAEGMTPKELGEFAEAEFLRTVLKMGMAVTKPWGESRGYDFIVDAAGKLTRVQVKAAFRRGKQGGYSLRTYRSSMECYTAKEIDALAGYVAPEEAWYLFPVRVVGRVRSLKLFPGSKKKRSKFERWREAWWVVTGR